MGHMKSMVYNLQAESTVSLYGIHCTDINDYKQNLVSFGKVSEIRAVRGYRTVGSVSTSEKHGHTIRNTS